MFIVWAQVLDEREKERARRRASKARRLRYKKSDEVVAIKPARADPAALRKIKEESGYHLFLSHVWSTGQDQMRIVKQRVGEMLPEARIFLDVDDIKEGRGQEYVDISNVVLVFMSLGYFTSPNCMRELLRAVWNKKKIIAVLETEEKHGGLTKGQIKEQLIEAVQKFDDWGLAREMNDASVWDPRRWEGNKYPGGDELFNKLFENEPIEWNRIGAFQDVTLHLIADELLLQTTRRRTCRARWLTRRGRMYRVRRSSSISIVLQAIKVRLSS